LQWFEPDLVEQCIFPRAEAKIPVLLEAMKSREGALQFLQIERQEREGEACLTERGELEVEETAEDGREPAVLERVIAADVTGQFFDHPYVQKNLRRRLRQAWHDLARSGHGGRHQGAIVHGFA
jgi:hypothetical protein